MSTNALNALSSPRPGLTSTAPPNPNTRWFVCALLFLATTINYMDRSVLSLIEPLLHLPFMGWIPGVDPKLQGTYNINYGHIIICFQIAYGLGLLSAGGLIDRVGTRIGYAVAILVWGLSSLSHSLVTSVAGFCIARALLGLGESGNFPAAIKATTEWFPAEERALATGLFNSGSNASFFIAPILIAAVTARFGWQSAFLCTGSMGLVWLVVWLVFPYNRLLDRKQDRTRPATASVPSSTPQQLAAAPRSGPRYRNLLRSRGLYAFSIAKALTDPIWWFYLFYLPKFLNENYGLNLSHAKYPLIVVYSVSSVGSILGGALSGFLMKRGRSVNSGRKLALLITSLCVLPIMLVPHMHTLFPTNAWPAIALFSLAAAAHQGWSANLFSTPTDIFPSTAISTVIGIGGAAGAAGGALFTFIVSHLFALHPLLIFSLAGFAYVTALALFQLLVPRLGSPAIA